MPIPKNHISDGVDKEFAVEPRSFDVNPQQFFESGMTKSVDSVIRLVNSSDTPKVVKRHEHLCQISEVLSPVPLNPTAKPLSRLVEIDNHAPPFSDPIQLDNDNILSPHIKNAFKQLHEKYDSVFDPAFGTYNHAFGQFEAVVNMGPVLPPQRKGRLPYYSQDKLSCLQDKIDKLTDLGVFADPSQIESPVEYLNPSFLVKKQNASDGFRLVTAFNEVAKYCKPQPSVMPTVDGTLRKIANWKYIIATDLTSAYYQIPLHKDSMRYCGTASPFRGTRVYTRCAMGMPGSECALEELLCKVLGDLMKQGKVTKIADDLYVGGDTPEELLQNWEMVLNCLARANLKLTAPKTVITPLEVQLLGWIWRQGEIRASPHRISSLA